MADIAVQDMDNVMQAPDMHEVLSDYEYVAEGSKCPDYKLSMQLSMDSGPIDVLENDKQDTTGRIHNTQDVVCSIEAAVLQPMSGLLMYLLGYAREYVAAAPECCHNIPPRAWMTRQRHEDHL